MADLLNNNNNNIHAAIEYDEAVTNQIGLRTQYIRILRQEYSMMHANNPPPLHFDAHITEEDMDRAKKMYENAIKSMELPRAITHQYLSELHYDSRKQLYDDWFSTWNQQLGHLRLYQRYRSLQLGNIDPMHSTASHFFMFTIRVLMLFLCYIYLKLCPCCLHFPLSSSILLPLQYRYTSK